MMTRLAHLAALVAVILAAFPMGAQTLRPRWPQLEPLKKEFYFPEASRAVVDLVLRDTSGRKLYTLHCRPGALALKPGKAFLLPNDPGFWGEFACHLHSQDTNDRYESLLIENPLDNDASHSRGEFYDYELLDGCLEYPEFGQRRSFRLRGMKLVLELSDIHFAANRPGHLASFHFLVEANPDPDALSAISEPPPFALAMTETGPAGERKLRCGTVIREHVPGIITEQYIRESGLNPPYAMVPQLTRRLQIDPEYQGDERPTSFPGKFTTAPQGRFASFQIMDTEGKPAYDFECDADKIVGNKTPIIEGNGLTCGLFLPGTKLNLLLDSVDPYSRMSPAVVLVDQLKSPNSEKPDWGTSRRFSLRGFILTLNFSDPVFELDEWGHAGLARASVSIEIHPDPAADTAVAKSPATPFCN